MLVVSRAASADFALQPTCSLQLVLLNFSMGYIADNKMIVRHFPLLRTTLSRDFVWTSLYSVKRMQALKEAHANKMGSPLGQEMSRVLDETGHIDDSGDSR